MVVFFFFKQKTAYEMRISDWSSDVCSSDLLADDRADRDRAAVAAAIGNDAEGAAVVAAVLHLDEGARPAGEARDEVTRSLGHRHDVVDAHRLAGCAEAARVQLLAVADHPVEIGRAPSDSITNAPLVCPLLLEQKNSQYK